MSGEWMKSSISDLIQAYKQHENLYNQKHKLYYNKQARNLSLKKILCAVQNNRAETSLAEITKKIQTLRTQFGQEMNKIEKSQLLGEDLIYKPKIWWFKHLEWIGDFMKTRTDSTPLSVRTKAILKQEKRDEELFEFAEVDEIDDTLEREQEEQGLYEYSEYDTETTDVEPIAKKQKTYQPSKSIRPSQLDESEVRTIEYTLINEETSELIPVSSKKQNSPIIEIPEIEHNSKQLKKFKRRSRTFGKYVSALLIDITDDKIFFELQRGITNSIHEASMKQQDAKKS